MLPATSWLPPSAPVLGPSLPPQPLAAPAPPAPLPPMAPDQWLAPPLPAQPGPVRVTRGGGGFDDLVAVLASFGLSFPLAGTGALVGVWAANPVLGASLAVIGGSLVGVLIAAEEIWKGSRPGASPPVRWKMVTGALIPAGLTAAGAAIGAAVVGTAGAVATGACIGVGLPFALLLGAIIRARLENRNGGPTPPA
ncbi:MAG: hypothetical protein VKP62_03865 [Candidatus Sericytochromatia bacterium]|nr:hypothetical protein [Candidatus Sericytochromatia bacterium]